MSITVGGALALAREEIGLASSRLGEAQAFALAKGIARLAVMDRARAQMAVKENGDLDPAGLSKVFMSRYEIDGFTVSATVYPASGFVSVAESDPAVWRQLLTGVGGMDNVAAATLAEQIVNSELEDRLRRLGAARQFSVLFAVSANSVSRLCRAVAGYRGYESRGI